MAEEVNYASVVFKPKRPKPEVTTEEDIVYDEVKINNETPREQPDANARKEEEIVYDEVNINHDKTQELPETNAKMEEDIVYSNVKIYSEKAKEHPDTNAKNKEEIVYSEVKINSKTTDKHPDTNGIKKEEVVHGEGKIHSETTEKYPDTKAGLLTDKEVRKRCCIQKLAYCFGIACVILSLAVAGVFVYIAFIHDVTSQLRSNQTALQEENYNLTSNINNLTSEKENLTRSLRDVTNQLNEFINLTKSRSLLKEEITNLTAKSRDLANEKKNLETQYQELEAKGTNLTGHIQSLEAEKKKLTGQIQSLETEKKKLTGQIQSLETEKKNLTGQIQSLEAELINFNTSRAQWSIDAYCPKAESSRTCKACENGWRACQRSCYAVNDHKPGGRRNWDKAREDCRGKGSDLVVVADDNEKKSINDYYSWDSSKLQGYWIGLRAEHGKWKWIDGSDLAEISWIAAPATDGQCVITVKDEGWKSVSCDEKQRWICEKAALSV